MMFVERAKADMELWDRTPCVEIEVLTGMTAAEDAYRRAPETVAELVAEVERLRAEKLGLEISESNLLVELRDEVERLRPRVIETVEQLDALPIRSLVRSDIGEVFERLRGGWDCLHEDGSAGLVMPFAIRLPARVLYTPAAVGE
ncbi:hypothetical protein I5H93_gp053 [Mycobacterium phage SuperGrey]|uniref:Uncharacterized protein n=5 Tax=Cheoctovirus TaxID=1623281 RepID=G1DU29_9CAUD|nr:hypothetical protein AVT13_gp050 [Mycobacterium phage Bipolar]YP_009608230.1 hypothetical protein FDI16_gp048 [Mycobacterium phage Shauna1]YP_009956083.1 hypothetical protein I5H28_gp054 [Mycobacterium phage Donkeykong]YP_009962823.1 hypothetical protein I5H93_gp053 [Mycobacterium phage SuperGrey]QIQ63737.1 hypothetical protein SEA_PHANPHAGIA_48 [Mycobacterium phage Phanphagia]UEM46019.1 hypothetical protein SEA_JALFARM20_61 [Mycobacterium phage JalFarm20]AEJ93023.1 hypothetical protein SH